MHWLATILLAADIFAVQASIFVCESGETLYDNGQLCDGREGNFFELFKMRVPRREVKRISRRKMKRIS